MVETEAFSIEGPDGEGETVELPLGLVDALAEQGEDHTHVVADVVVQAFVQRGHAIVHHSEGEVPPDLAAANDLAEDIFEERFGVSVAEAFGHGH
jgi:hypothetical protein